MSGAFVQWLKDSAYGSLDTTGHSLDIGGWMDESFLQVFDGIVRKRGPGSPLMVIEVGSWKGLSTNTMAEVLKRYGLSSSSSIIAVDTWLGAPEFWTWGLEDPTRGLSLKLVDGYPTVFYTFTKNAKLLGNSDVIAPFPISSLQGADVLKQKGIVADVIYVDASHEYAAVKQDIEAYWELLKPGGVMLGDDYSQNWPGVCQAVNEFAQSRGISPTFSGVVWAFEKTA